MRTNHVDEQLIRQREDMLRSCQVLTPPWVVTSDGETVAGTYRRDGLLAGALAGLPAVVGVEHATRLIRDRQRIRVHGTDGYVEFLPEPALPCRQPGGRTPLAARHEAVRRAGVDGDQACRT